MFQKVWGRPTGRHGQSTHTPHPATALVNESPRIMATTTTIEDSTLQHAKAHTAFLLANSPIYGHLLSTLEITAATPARVVARLRLEPPHLNSKHILHGAVTATLVDFMGGLAIAAHDGRERTGVSADMHISYVGAARLGDVLEVEGVPVKVGGSLAFTTVTLRRVVDGAQGAGEGVGNVVALGSHTKFVRQKS